MKVFYLPHLYPPLYYISPGVTITELLFTGMLQMVFGVMYLEFLDYYNSDPASVAWVGALAAVMNSSLGKLYYS